MAYKFWTSINTASWIRNLRTLPQRIQKYFGYLYAKWLVKTGRVLERSRSYNGVLTMLEKNAVKELLYGGLNEILQNKHYYYNSSIGSKYNHFTDAGKVALEEYIKNMSAMMLAAEEISLNKRAKELVIKGLKGEKI